MQRPLALYSLALATLAGAFWLTPKIIEPTPLVKPVVKTPTPKTNIAPITHLSYGDKYLTVDAKLDRALIAAQNRKALYLDVALNAAASNERADLATVLVIDRSGSMAGDKIDNARMAAARFLNHLNDGDRIAVVSYGTDVSVDLRMTALDAKTRRTASRVIARIEEGGGTNIDGGLRTANRILREAKLSGEAARIVLISDGRPTEGARGLKTLSGHAQSTSDLGATLSTIGVGLDYNEVLMAALARKGAGRYHYLRRSSQLAKILDDEVKHASRSVARRVSLNIDDTFCGYRFKAAPGQNVTRTKNGATLSLGDLAANEVRRVLVEFSPTSEECKGASPRAPEVVYVPNKSNTNSLLSHKANTFRLDTSDDANAIVQSERDDVRLRVLEVDAALTLEDSMKSYSEGKVAVARKRMKAKRAKLEVAAKKSGSTRMKRAVLDFADAIQKLDAAPSSSKGQDLIKSARESSFNSLR